MIHVGSAFPSGIVPLDNLWEGAKILVADWINHLPMLVIDGPNQPIRSTKRNNVITERRGKLIK